MKLTRKKYLNKSRRLKVSESGQRLLYNYFRINTEEYSLRIGVVSEWVPYAWEEREHGIRLISRISGSGIEFAGRNGGLLRIDELLRTHDRNRTIWKLELDLHFKFSHYDCTLGSLHDSKYFASLSAQGNVMVTADDMFITST